MTRTRTQPEGADTRSAPTACDCCRATTEPLERLTLAGGVLANACVHPTGCIQRAKRAGRWLLDTNTTEEK